MIGFAGMTQGYTGLEDTPAYYPTKIHAFRNIDEYGFKHISEEEAEADFTTPDKK
ncbi:MAG: hypothetical protein K2K05_05040 [Muribaculaceae bacterium]|nr:hypothetical protein [Muribaculaceae bacterium]